MIYRISSPDKVNWIFKFLKKFCKRGKVNYSPGELAHWIRLNINNPSLRICVSKNGEGIKGFHVSYLVQEIMTPTCFVQNFYSENKEAKEELVNDLIDWAADQGVYRVKYETAHEPDWMIERFDLVEKSKGFKVCGHVLEKHLEED